MALKPCRECKKDVAESAVTCPHCGIGHARRETLAIYQHVALDGDLEAKYQQTMKDVGL